jgi:serine O-acetyltransferase
VYHLFPNMYALWSYRFSHWAGNHHMKILATLIVRFTHIITGGEFGWQARIAPGVFLEHPFGCFVGDDVVVGEGCVIGAHVMLAYSSFVWNSNPRHGAPTLGKDVYVWAKASVIGPITVGDGAVIGAHALVLRDVPPGAVARGVPAKFYGPDGSEITS